MSLPPQGKGSDPGFSLEWGLTPIRSLKPMPYPNLTHHGGATGVTGSCHRLQLAADRALLVDCGLFQGQDAESADNLEQHRVTFPVDDVLALIVTHVHIDHIGRLPYLLAAGYRGPILCSVPSARLLPLVIEDALKVGFTRDRKLIERFLEEVHSRLVPLDYQTWHTLIEDERHHVRIRLRRAGHILGSAYVEGDIQTPKANPSLRGGEAAAAVQRHLSRLTRLRANGGPRGPAARLH